MHMVIKKFIDTDTNPKKISLISYRQLVLLLYYSLY